MQTDVMSQTLKPLALRAVVHERMTAVLNRLLLTARKRRRACDDRGEGTEAADSWVGCNPIRGSLHRPVCYRKWLSHVDDQPSANATVRLPEAAREQCSDRRGCQCFGAWRLRANRGTFWSRSSPTRRVRRSATLEHLWSRCRSREPCFRLYFFDFLLESAIYGTFQKSLVKNVGSTL